MNIYDHMIAEQPGSPKLARPITDGGTMKGASVRNTNTKYKLKIQIQNTDTKYESILHIQKYKNTKYKLQSRACPITDEETMKGRGSI